MRTKDIHTLARKFAIVFFAVIYTMLLKGQSQFTYFSQGLFEEGRAHTGIATVEANGGFYLVGDFGISASESDVVLHFLNSKGEVLWTKILIPNGEYFEAGLSLGGQMILASDNNLVLTYTVADQGAFGHHNIVVRKLDFEGNNIWTFETDPENIDEELNPTIIEGHQGDFFVVYDYTRLEQGLDPQKIGLTKLNALGEEIWTKQILDEENVAVGLAGRSLIAHSEGDYFIGGSFGIFGQFQDMFVYKFDEDGNELWRMGYGDDSREGHAFITELDNGQIWITAQRSIENLPQPDTRFPQVILIDTEGNILYNIIYDFVTESNFTGQFGIRSTLAQFNNHVYAVAPKTRLDELSLPWLWKVNAEADTVFTQTLVWNDSIYTEIIDLETTSDGGLVATGYTLPPVDTTTGELVMPQMAWLVKMDTLGNFCHPLGCDSTVFLSSSALEEIFEQESLQFAVSPNPASVELARVHFTIPEEVDYCKWHLFDLQGREKRSVYISGTGSQEIPLRHCSPGIYTWVLEYNGSVLKNGKLVLN